MNQERFKYKEGLQKIRFKIDKLKQAHKNAKLIKKENSKLLKQIEEVKV